MHMRTLPTRRPPRVSQREDNGTDTPFDLVRSSPHADWGGRAFWGAILGSVLGFVLWLVYALIVWAKGLIR